MKVLNHKSTDGAQNECGATEGIDANLGLHLVRGFGVKSLKAKSAELSGLAAAGSWRFTRANLNLVAEFVTFELTGVHGSGVVAAWSNGSPSADSLGRGNNGQRVTNVDVYDFVPTDGNCCEWIRDNHALIENFNFWSNENQVGRENAGYGPQTARDGGQGFFGQPQCDGEQRAKGKHQPSKNVATSRSKDLSITHVSIIAGDK